MIARDAYHELCGYTLALRDLRFVHQHVVDAFAAQNADGGTKPITLAFALIGLHLHVDRQFSGAQVQRAHQYLAGRTKMWPPFRLPTDRGAITAADVMKIPPGKERAVAITAWCACVWSAFRVNHDEVATLVRAHGI
jgi:hypothetical protein